LGFFQRFFGIFDEVYEDFQSNLPLALHCKKRPACNNVENRPEQNFAAHIVPAWLLINNKLFSIVQAVQC
jgi:hypothetical protein